MSTNTESSETSERYVPNKFEALKQHILEHKIEMTIWFTRILTIMFTMLYFVPIVGNLYNSYYKALIANAATSALRLHQRQPRMNLSMEYFSAIIREDSCHYFAYSMIFMYVAPFTLVLLPVFLFAVIHFASYSLTILDTLGQNSWWGARLLISLVELQSSNILHLIACIEIILMPFCIILILLGRAGLLTSFVYYQFLSMRCKSRRNPSTRNMFNSMKMSLSNVAARPGTPDILRKVINSFVSFLTRMVPTQ